MCIIFMMIKVLLQYLLHSNFLVPRVWSTPALGWQGPSLWRKLLELGGSSLPFYPSPWHTRETLEKLITLSAREQWQLERSPPVHSTVASAFLRWQDPAAISGKWRQYSQSCPLTTKVLGWGDHFYTFPKGSVPGGKGRKAWHFRTYSEVT